MLRLYMWEVFSNKFALNDDDHSKSKSGHTYVEPTGLSHLLPCGTHGSRDTLSPWYLPIPSLQRETSKMGVLLQSKILKFGFC